MSMSQNVVFEGELLNDSEPKGLEIAQILVNHLSDDKFKTSSVENWRDCGWEFKYYSLNVSLTIRIASIDLNQWLLQIIPSQIPGLISRTLGKKATAEGTDVYELSKKVHNGLNNCGFRLFQWSWDDDPRIAKSPTSYPLPSTP